MEDFTPKDERSNQLSRWSPILGLALATSLVASPIRAEPPTPEPTVKKEAAAESAKPAEQQPAATPAAQSQAKEPRITAEVHTSHHEQLSIQERQALSHAAGRILLHVDKAEQELVHKEKDKALGHVQKALSLVAIIEYAAPEVEVKATIKAGGTVYQDETKVKEMIVPVFQELDEVSLVGPLRSAKKAARKTRGPVVEDTELQYASVSLDVNWAKRHLQQAEKELNKGDLKAAKRDLASVSTDLVFELDETGLPLVQARQNLALAKDLIKDKQPAAARAALQTASQSLQRYEKEVGGTHAKRSEDLRKEIDALGQKVEHDQAGAVEQIDHWWDRLLHWYQA